MADHGLHPAVTYAGAPVDLNAQHKRKKSRVIPPDRRKKVAQACDMCKKRKQKCNGLQPCNLCSSKELQCLYTAIDRRVLKPSRKQLEDNMRVTESPSRNSTDASSSLHNTPSGRSTEVSSVNKSSQQGQSSPQSLTPHRLPDQRIPHYPASVENNSRQQQMLHQQSSLMPPGYGFSWSDPQQQQQQQQQQIQYAGHLPQAPLQHHPVHQPEQQYQQYQILRHTEQQHYVPGQPLMAMPQHGVASPVPSRDPYHPRAQMPQNVTMSNANVPTPTSNSHTAPSLSHPTTSHDTNSNGKRRASSSPFSQNRVQIPASLQPLLSFPLNIQANEVHDESYNDYVIPTGTDQNWRLLFDEAGNLRYLGESSVTAYLLQCRKLFQKVLGPQKFSDDPERFTYTDNPVIPLETRAKPGLPDRNYTDYLVTTYLNNLNNVLYILDDDALSQLVDRVYMPDHPNVPQKDRCILYLVLAIASVYSSKEISKKLFPFPEDYFTNPLEFFEMALTILNSTTEDDNIWLAEAYLLIFFYFQFTGHKNTAWIKLGSAIRYAQGLGLNRKFVNESYKDPKFVLHRRKLFRSLFIMDTLSSVHLGRSMTIRLQEWDDIKFFDSIDDYQNKLLRVCEMNAKILEGIYYNPAVTLKIALNLAVDMKIYTMKNPIKPVSPENYPAPVDHKSLLPHVIYLHGIILLSRPFFHFVVLKKLGLVNYDPSSKNLPHLQNFYHSCIKSSLLIVKIVEYCYYQNIHPFKPLGLVSCTFHAGLVLGLLLLLRLKGIDHEMFKNDPHINADPEAILSHAMASVIKVLVHYGKIDPQCKRYAMILQYMLDVTKHLPDNLDANDSDASSHTTQERINTQQNFENILRFQDWLFPKPENLSAPLADERFEVSPDSNDDFLKDIAGLNNVDTSGTQFLDDFLYTVIDSSASSSSLRPLNAISSKNRPFSGTGSAYP